MDSLSDEQKVVFQQAYHIIDMAVKDKHVGKKGNIPLLVNLCYDKKYDCLTAMFYNVSVDFGGMDLGSDVIVS